MEVMVARQALVRTLTSTIGPKARKPAWTTRSLRHVWEGTLLGRALALPGSPGCPGNAHDGQMEHCQ